MLRRSLRVPFTLPFTWRPTFHCGSKNSVRAKKICLVMGAKRWQSNEQKRSEGGRAWRSTDSSRLSSEPALPSQKCRHKGGL
jgi:hypothetical protein